MLSIHLFGSLRAFDGDTALPPLNPPKALALWAHLLLRRDRPLSRDQVAFALWADVPEAEARANLRRHLHLLRRHLPPAAPGRPWLITEHETVQWNRQSDYWLDVEAFKQAAGDPWQTTEPVATREAIARLQAAVGHYGGDLLENFYDDWVLAERERLREQFTEMLERLAALQESVSDLRGAIATAQRLLAHNPLREETHRRLMGLCYLAGDRAAALHQFKECRRLLREELDVEPMAETVALRQAILSGRPLTLAPSRAIAQASAASPLTAPVVSSDSLPARAPIIPSPGPAPLQPSPHPSRLKHTAQRLLGWPALAVLLTVTALAALGFLSNLLRPTATVVLGGPEVAQDIWITSEIPDTGFDPEFPNDL